MIDCKTYIKYKCPNCGHKNHKRLYDSQSICCSKCNFPVESIWSPANYLVYSPKLLEKIKKLNQ